MPCQSLPYNPTFVTSVAGGGWYTARELPEAAVSLGTVAQGGFADWTLAQAGVDASWYRVSARGRATGRVAGRSKGRAKPKVRTPAPAAAIAEMRSEEEMTAYRKLARRTPPNGVLRRLAANYPPPPEWVDQEEGRPF